MGEQTRNEKKLFDTLNKLGKARYRASKKKSEFFMNRTKWLGHEIDENGIKPNEEKVDAILKLNPTEKNKRTKIISRSNPIHGKIPTDTLL